MKRSEELKEQLKALDAWMSSEPFKLWLAARDKEVEAFNAFIQDSAADFNEVLQARAKRDNTTDIKDTFEDIRDTLKTKIDETVELETKLAASGKL